MAVQKYAGDKFVGLSSDVKPLNVADGATFFEYDTHKLFNKISGFWVWAPASGVAYSNADFPAFDDVRDALDYLLYTPLSISSFTNSVGSVEIGSTVNSVVLNWSYNHDVISQSLTDVGVVTPASLRAYGFSSLGLTSNKTWTLSSTDGTTPKNANTIVSFLHKRYWGVSPLASLSDADILSLSKELSSTRIQSRTMNATGGNYLWFAWPDSFGSGEFWTNGLQNTAWTLTTRSFVNASGYSSTFRIYRSTFIQNGSGIDVEVR